jgi:mono/diheme cytochrome c family protein
MHRHSSKLRPLLLASALALAGTPAAFAEDLSGVSGAQLYRQFCASCHGKGGEGDGAVAPFFKLSPPDLTLISKRHGGIYPDEWVRKVVNGTTSIGQHGSREMPIWGLQFAMTAPGPVQGKVVADATIARLVDHLRTIQKAPVK